MLREFIDKANEKPPEYREADVCKAITMYLQEKYDGPWVSVIGRRFTANILHEPCYFMRAST